MISLRIKKQICSRKDEEHETNEEDACDCVSPRNGI